MYCILVCLIITVHISLYITVQFIIVTEHTKDWRKACLTVVQCSCNIDRQYLARKGQFCCILLLARPAYITQIGLFVHNVVFAMMPTYTFMAMN